MPRDRHSAGRRARSVLFIAQLPPPHHGQSAMAAIMHDMFEGDARLVVTRKWRGGARSNEDIGARRPAKYLGFARLVLELGAMWLMGRRFDFAYLGLAPWARTATRDALLTWLARQLCWRVLIHVHGDGLPRLLESSSFRAKLIRAGLSGSEILAITAETARSAAASGIFSRVITLPNMAADPGTPRSEPSRPLTISCLGNLDPRKGVLDFVDVIGVLSRRGISVQAAIVGGSTALLSVEQLRDRVTKLGLSHYIAVTGRVSEEKKAAILRASDVFLYLSRHDLSPVALLEALAHANAPIVIDIGGLREMLGPQLGDNVLPADISGNETVTRAAGKIAAYAADRDLLERDRRRARTQYLETYHPDAFRARLLDLLAKDPLRAKPDAAGRGLGCKRNAVKHQLIEIVRRAHLPFASAELPNRVALYFHELERGHIRPFRDAVGYFLKRGYRTVSPGDYSSGSEGDKQLFISFDDNYRSWYEALDTFDDLGVTCTFYVNTCALRDSATRSAVEAYFDRIDYRGDRTPLSRAELRELHNAGHTIGCHTHSHPELPRLRRDKWLCEIDYCKAFLEDIIGAEVRDFSFPFGMRRHFSHALRIYCREHGFRTIATGIAGQLYAPRIDPFAMHRTQWKFERSLFENLDNLRIDARLFARVFGRSVIG